MQPIRLLVTDFDGTVINSAKEVPFYTTFRDRINELRRDYGTVWVVCTGRSLGAFRDKFILMQKTGIRPDFVVSRHAYIHSLTPFGYMPHVFWNLHIRYQLWLSLLDASAAIKEWYDVICRFASGVRTVKAGKYRLWLRFDSEETASSVATMLKEKTRPYHHLTVFKYLFEVDVRLVPFTKGLAVAELAHRLEIDPTHILAVGNGHNDISMLDGKTAKMTGCPANSDPEVIEVVHQSGGHIANCGSLEGVLEILDAYKTGTVRSDLPADWIDPAQTANSLNWQSKAAHKGHTPRSRTLPWVLAAAAYVVLLVLAIYMTSFPFARLITKPFWILINRLAF